MKDSFGRSKSMATVNSTNYKITRARNFLFSSREVGAGEKLQSYDNKY